jgi:hypothetical protein
MVAPQPTDNVQKVTRFRLTIFDKQRDVDMTEHEPPVPLNAAE